MFVSIYAAREQVKIGKAPKLKYDKWNGTCSPSFIHSTASLRCIRRLRMVKSPGIDLKDTYFPRGDFIVPSNTPVKEVMISYQPFRVALVEWQQKDPWHSQKMPELSAKNFPDFALMGAWELRELWLLEVNRDSRKIAFKQLIVTWSWSWSWSWTTGILRCDMCHMSLRTLNLASNGELLSLRVQEFFI